MSNAITHDSVPFGGTTIHYRIVRSRERKTLGITVGQGRITVSAPCGMRAAAIRPWLLKKAVWVVAKMDEDARLRRQWPRRLVSGEAISYLGRQFPLKVVPSSPLRPVGVRLWAGTFELVVNKSDPKLPIHEQGRVLLKTWMKEHLIPRLIEPVGHFAKALAVHPPKYRVMDLGGRWGSCNPRTGLSFHWQLATVPHKLIEYVVAHEMCHLLHGRHDKSFHAALNRILSDATLRHAALAEFQGISL